MNFRLARDPAILLTLFATAVRFIAAFWVDVSPEQQGWWNAAAAAVAGVIVAVFVKREKQVPAILGALNALMALAIGYGLHWSAEQQAIVISLAGAVLAAYTRTQVDAPVPAPAPTVQFSNVTPAP
jgi:hypothetical protein